MHASEEKPNSVPSVSGSGFKRLKYSRVSMRKRME
jgi:hypothetical protein